jgi:hypothetical protein
MTTSQGNQLQIRLAGEFGLSLDEWISKGYAKKFRAIVNQGIEDYEVIRSRLFSNSSQEELNRSISFTETLTAFKLATSKSRLLKP